MLNEILNSITYRTCFLKKSYNKEKHNRKLSTSAGISMILILVIAASLFPGCSMIKAARMIRDGAVYGNTHENVSIPFSLYGHFIMVKVKLNNSEKERSFIFDTGAVTVINKKLADTMYFNDKVTITGRDPGGGEAETNIVQIDTLEIGNKKIKKCAAANDIDYLLTWNCKHLANAQIIRKISVVCNAGGYNMPVICTPEELMGG